MKFEITDLYSTGAKTMKNALGMTMAGTTLLLAANAVQAQSANNWYWDVRAGVALPQDTAIKSSPYGGGGDIDFDAGLHVGVALGYRLSPSVAMELETGVLWNSVNEINGNNFSNVGGSADFYQIPVLANVVYTPLHGAFSPFIGVGVGEVTAIFDSSHLPLFGPGTGYSDTDFVFAYQATAGFKYAVNERLDLGLAYQFLDAARNDWSDHGVPFETGDVRTHSIMATLTWRF
jgi:opacity protein-like surface antigen